MGLSVLLSIPLEIFKPLVGSQGNLIGSMQLRHQLVGTPLLGLQGKGRLPMLKLHLVGVLEMVRACSMENLQLGQDNLLTTVEGELAHQGL